jgi:hypothetical protein
MSTAASALAAAAPSPAADDAGKVPKQGWNRYKVNEWI